MNFSLDIDWQSIASGPRWQRHLAAVLISLILFVVTLYFCIMPEWKDNRTFNQRLMVAQKISVSARQQLAALPRINTLKQQIQALKELQAIHGYYPSAMSTLTKTIADYISLSGGRLIDLKHDSGSTTDSGIVIYRWKLTMKATYFQFIEFAQLINNGMPLLAIDNLVMNAESGLLNISIGLSLYQLKMGH